MKLFTVYNNLDEVLRTGICSAKDFRLQLQRGEGKIIEGFCDQRKQKIDNDKIVNKTPQEIAAEKPSVVPVEKQTAHITNEQLQDVLNRLTKLETKA